MAPGPPKTGLSLIARNFPSGDQEGVSGTRTGDCLAVQSRSLSRELAKDSLGPAERGNQHDIPAFG